MKGIGEMVGGGTWWDRLKLTEKLIPVEMLSVIENILHPRAQL